MNWQVLKACVTLFIASFCTMVIELVAGRILAPYVGVSLYTWTSIIGVVLLGISLGAYLGGFIADRFPRPSTLGWLLLLAGLAALTIAPLADQVGGRRMLENDISLMNRILILTALIFFVPALILGMISPVVVRLSIESVERSGNVVGRIYAFSTLGSIMGTFATGFYLIELMGTRTILYAVAAVLILCAPIFGGLLAGRPARALVVLVCLVAIFGSLGTLYAFRDVVSRPPGLTAATSFYKESDYYTIKVLEDEHHGEPMRTLVLDHLIHSYTNMNDPYYLKYDYLRIYEELVAWKRSEKQRNDFLFVGGGGYTLPRFFDARYPDSRIDVVEIDPWVTKVAEEYLGIKGTRISSFNDDARWWVMNRNDQYDFIFGDAFNDLSIPYHLTTKEFNDHLKRVLRPDGLLMCLVIDNLRAGEFVPTYVRTLQESFGTDNVALITIHQQWPPKDLDEIETTTAIVVASQQPLNLEGFEKFLKSRLALTHGLLNACWAINPYQQMPLSFFPSRYSWNTSIVTNPERLKRYLAERKRKPIVLTDDYVPADNLVAPMFEERFGYQKR